MVKDNQWAKKKLDFVIDLLEDGPKFIEGDSSNVDYYIPREGIRVLTEIMDAFPKIEVSDIVEFKDLKEEGYQYAKKFYVYTKAKEIANELGVTLRIDKEKPEGPILAQYQQQVSSQVNLQTVDNVIECINSLDVKFEQKTELVKLTKEFEENLEKKDAGKLKI